MDATADTSLRTLTAGWRGDRSWRDVLRGGDIAVEGPTAVLRALPEWFGRSQLAVIPRPA